MNSETPERWARISSLFDEAVRLPREERAAFLARACGDDEALKAGVLRLLDSADRASGFLEEPLLSHAGVVLREAVDALETDTDPTSPDDAETASLQPFPDSPVPLDTTGPYRLLQKIGEGGMGEVYLAEQSEPIRRQVALKVIKAGLDTKQVVGRFEAERQALALMDHPGIAKVYEAGETPRGLPYFAMEYVKGEPITTYCDRHRLGTAERLELFARVCEAVQHAHQKGVIHRDLKPSNVLVSIVGDKPQPKVIDFGVAKATAQKLTEKTMFTELGVLIGTPEYMSPEQAEMTGLDVDTRTDVYALGVMLYELLTGALPFDSKELRQAGYDEIRRRIREVDPPKPSTRVRTQGEHSTEAAKNRQTDPGRLASRLRGDLDWIVMRALEKDRTRRYGTPSELAADLQRHLLHEPVLAGPPGAAYRSRKFVRRHRFGVAAASLAVLGLAAFGIIMAIQARTIARERDRAERVSEFLVELFRVSDPSEARGNSITAREVLDRGAARIDKELGKEPLVQAQMMLTMGTVYQSLGLAAKAEPLLASAAQIRGRLLGKDARPTLEAQSRLNTVLISEGRHDEAEKSLQALLKEDQRILGADDPESLYTLHLLADVTDRLGRYSESEKLYRRAYEARRRVLGEDHRDTLQSLRGLAVSLERQGNYDQSLELQQRILEAHQRTLGQNHSQTAWSIQNVASIIYKQGKISEAEKMYRQAYEIMLHVLGQDHPDTLWVENNLAGMLFYLNRLDEAEDLYRNNLSIRRRVLGPGHPQTLASWSNLANVLSARGEHAEAKEIYRQVLEARIRIQGRDHPSVPDTVENLGLEYAATKHYEESVHLLRQALEANRRIRGPAHPDTLTATANLASVLAEMGKLSEAESYCRESLDQQRKVLGANHPDTLNSIVVLASIKVQQGHRQEALQLLRKAVDDGFADTRSLEQDLGLQKLKGDPEFQHLAAAVVKNQANQDRGSP